MHIEAFIELVDELATTIPQLEELNPFHVYGCRLHWYAPDRRECVYKTWLWDGEWKERGTWTAASSESHIQQFLKVLGKKWDIAAASTNGLYSVMMVTRSPAPFHVYKP